jgi:phosphatidylglycerophosphate synthase
MNTQQRARPPFRPPLLVAGAIAAAGAGASVLAAALATLVLDDPGLAWRTLGAAIVLGALLAWLAGRHWTAPTLGAANGVTLARGALTALLIGLCGSAPSAALGWTVVAAALAALALDGVDGKLARSSGTASRFGARFDMETDALLILVLTVLAWQLGKAGVWIVLAGALRYLFVAAGAVLPWLARELPPSRRRQTVCVVQIVSLVVALAPFVEPPASTAAAAAGLIVLAVSFAIDVEWLARARGG